MILGEPFGQGLASRFAQGIKDHIGKKVVHCQLDDQYTLDQVILGSQSPKERVEQAQGQQKLKEAKEAGCEFNFAQAC